MWRLLVQPVVRWWNELFNGSVPCPTCKSVVVPTQFGRTLRYNCGCGWDHREKLYDM